MVWVFFYNFDFIEGTFARKYPNKFDFIEFYRLNKEKNIFLYFRCSKIWHFAHLIVPLPPK